MAVNLYYACSFEHNHMCQPSDGGTVFSPYGSISSGGKCGNYSIKGSSADYLTFGVLFDARYSSMVAAAWIKSTKNTMIRIKDENGNTIARAEFSGSGTQAVFEVCGTQDTLTMPPTGYLVWHYYVIEVKSDGTVNFYFDGEIVHSMSASCSSISIARVEFGDDSGTQYVDCAVCYEPPYIGAISFVPARITGTSTAGMGNVTPSGSQEHEVLSDNDDDTYVATQGDNGYSEESRYSIEVDNTVDGLDVKRIVGVIIGSRSSEDTATSSTVELGIDDESGHRTTSQRSLTTDARGKSVYITQDPASGDEFSSTNDIENYLLVLRHNIVMP